MLEAFLAQVKADGITLIGLTTPYHFLVHERMREAGVFINMDLILARMQEIVCRVWLPLSPLQRHARLWRQRQRMV